MNIYKRGIEWLCAAGLMRPLGHRVEMKAILSTDASSIISGKEDTRQAACHQVTNVGPDVTKVKVGDMVLSISTATDAADFDKVDGRYTFCHEDDIVTWWNQAEAEAAHRRFFPEEYQSHAQEAQSQAQL